MANNRTYQGHWANIVVAAVLLLGFAALCWWLYARPAAGGELVALVHDAEGQVHELSLDQDAELVLESEAGRNVIQVRDHSVFMAEADCSGLDCTRMAPIARPGAQIICLPHKVWIEVAPRGSAAGELDLSAASPQSEHGVDLVSR